MSINEISEINRPVVEPHLPDAIKSYVFTLFSTPPEQVDMEGVSIKGQDINDTMAILTDNFEISDITTTKEGDGEPLYTFKAGKEGSQKTKFEISGIAAENIQRLDRELSESPK